MRLVINGRFLTQPVTGVQRVAIEFVQALDRLIAVGEYPGLAVEVVVPAGATLETNPALESIALCRAGRFGGHGWEQLSLPRLVRGARLLNLGNSAPLWSLLFAADRTHVMVHDLSYHYFPSAYDWRFKAVYSVLIPMVLRRAAGVATVSESERAAIIRAKPRSVRPERLYAVQNGVTRYDLGRPSPGRPERGRRVLYVGSLTARKNAPGLLRAAVELVRHHDAEVVVVGATGVQFGAVDTSIPDTVASKIRFVGQVNDPAELADWYRSSAVFLFPSFYEASPLPPTEAMSYGCPVVVSDIRALRERCGGAAEYCDPRDVGSIVSRVAAVLDNPQRWERLAALGSARASEYTWEDQVRTVLGRVMA